MIEQPENQNNVLTSSVSQNPVASELDGDSIDSAVQNALTENALNQNKKTQILTPVQQLTPIENAVNETIKRNNESNKTALNQSLVSASAKDPDTAAKSQALAASLNVSTGVVDFDIELAKRQKLLRQAEVMKLVEKYPSLARRFLDKEFAEVAHDDIDNLAKTSDLSNQLRGNLPVGMGSGDNTLFGENATKYSSEMFTDFERGMISGTNTTTYGELAYRAQIPVLTIKDFAYAPQRSILEQRPDLEQSIQYAESVFSEQEEYRGTWSESFGIIVGQLSAMMVEASAVGTLFGGTALGVGILGPQIALPEEVATVPAAVSLGFTTSLIDQTRRVETGSAFVEYYRGSEDYEPLPYEEAAWAANIVGTLNASIELASTAFFFTPLASALPKAFLKKSIVNAFRKAITKSGATKAAATHFVKSVATEQGTEWVQEGTIVLGSEITGVLTDPNFQSALSTPEGRERLEERFSSIFEVTIKGTVPLAFITGGFGLSYQMRQIAKSQKRQKLITDAIRVKGESKVNKRSKTTYTSYLAEQLSGESLHIGVEQFEQARRKNGVGLQEVEKIIPGITEQVAKAKASGGDVVIPTSLYLSELIDTEFGVSIRNDIRADAEGMSINEIAESQEFLKELKSINKQAIEDFKKTNKDWAESAGKIEEEVFAKIKAAGNYTEEQARMLAQWHRDTAVVLASRFGMTPEQFNAKFGLSIESAYTPEQQAPAQQVAPTINELEKFLTVEDRQELSDLEKQRTEDDGGTLSDRSKLAIQDRKSDLIQQRKLEQDRPEVMKSLLEENAGKESDITSMVRRFLSATGTAAGNVAVAFDMGLISDLELLVIIKRLESITNKESSDDFRNWAYSHKNKEIGKAFGELPIVDEMNEHPKTASQLIAKLIPETIAQNKLDREAQAKAREAKQAPAQGSFEQASRADLGLGQQAAPAPDSGVFDANNPPVSSEAIFALMDADGKIYYDINATMHGDLVETFPDITNTVIDGGFIVNGKYMMGKSDGGYSAFEGEQKQIDAVRNFTEQANTQGFQESNYRPAVVAWAKEKFGDRTAPDGSTVWQNFTEWFGDSKVVDAEGKPMVVYHGTSRFITEFKRKKGGRSIWFTASSDTAGTYAGFPEGIVGANVIPTFLAMKNPMVFDAEGGRWDMLIKDGERVSTDSLSDLAEELGHDGLIVRNISDDDNYLDANPSDHFAVFSPTQIKSAIANTGEFSATDPNILRQAADRAATSKARYAQLVRPPSTEFAQSAQNKPARGFFNPKQLKMMLGSKSDFTTFIHELAHYNLTVLGRIASDPQSPSQIREDMDTTLSWFGIAGENPEQRLANWNAMTLEEQRRHHETFAYNHEIYLSEGKSPSIEMQGVFERFSQFVKRIYISIRDDLNAIYKQEFGTDLPMMTGEIRRVMDRMIATDEQIRSAEERRNMENIFKDQELSGMDDAQWASYQQMRAEATQKSVSELNEQSLAATTWASRLKAKKVKELEAEQEELRSEIRKQVKKEVESRNVYRAIKFLKYGILQTAGGEEVEFTGSNKLNTNAVKLMVPKENMDKFGSGKNGMVALDGYHPDIVSEMFNYSSGDELILAILDAKPMDEVIDGITEDRMEIENGELNSPQAIEAAADKAVHNEARVKLVAVELRWLTKATQPVRAMIAAAKSVAKQMLETKRLRDIKPGDYASAAARAAKESQTAYFASQSAETAAKTAYTRHYNKMIAEGVEEAKAVEMATKVSDEALAKAESRSEAHKKKYGKMKPSEVAAQAKRSQLLQEQLALEAKEVKDEIKSQIKKFKRFFENDKKIAKTRNMDLVNAARSILAFYGLGKHNKLPSAYLEQLKEYNPNLFETVFAMVTRAQIGTPDYQSLTVEEFRSMKETVDALWELANRENQIRVEGEVVLVNQAVDELNARIDEIGVPTKIAGETQAVTGKDRLVRHINSTKAILRRVQNWADATDGANNVVGPFTKYIWRPISQALNAYRIDRNKYVKRYVELLKEIALPVGKIVAPELNYTFGADNGGIGIAELLGAIMHSGNISNLEKLLIGRKWATVSEDGTMDTSRWYAFVARVTNDGTLTKQHFDFIQATWDLNEELKPMAQKAHHDIEGYYFKEVEATPFTNQFGTYRGGYVPAKTDPFIVRDAQRQAKMSELESDFRAAMPSTGAGFTESRVKYNKPLSLDIRLIAKHIDDVIRYSHVQPAVKDVMRILNKRSFADKLTRMDSMAIDEMIIPWLNRSARQITSDPGRSKWVDNFWRTIRSRTGMAIMIGNIRNALQQPTGLFMSATKVKPSNLGNAFLAYLSSPHKTAQEVSSLSSFMSNKLENQIFDLQNAMNELLLNPNAYKKIERWTLHHAYFLQSAFQNMADIVTWVGAYNQYLEESGVGVSNADAQKEAVNRADAAVQLTQGTRNPESIAAFEVGTPFYQTFIQFTGYYSMLANLNTDEYVKIFRDLGWRGNKGKLVYTFLMGFAAQAIVSDAIVRTLGGDWEDDDDDGYLDVVMDWIFGSMARSAVAMVPFGSSAYTALTTAYNNKPYDDRITSSPSISALESSTVGVGKAIINVVSEDKEITGQNVKDVATLISVSTGIPMTLLGRPASYLVDVDRGAVEPTSTADLVRGLITGTASKESKK